MEKKHARAAGAPGRDAAPPRRVWALTDGVPGHEARTRGMLAALSRLGPVEPVPVPGALRGRLARAAMAMAGARAPWPLVVACHRMTLPDGRPDLVTGAGGRTQFLTAALAARFGVPSLFAGLPRHMDGRRFAAVLCPYPVPGLPNLVELEVPLSDLTPDAARDAGAGLAAEGRVWTLLAGGDGGGYRHAREEWATLGRALAARAAAAGARLCVATSRRTGAAAEAALADAIPDPLLAVWWGRGDRAPILPLIGAADLVFVTADSASMIGEAVAAGRPVVAVSPRDAAPADRHRAVLDGMVRRGRLRLLGPDLAGLPGPEGFTPLTVSPVETLAETLRRLL